MTEKERERENTGLCHFRIRGREVGKKFQLNLVSQSCYPQNLANYMLLMNIVTFSHRLFEIAPYLRDLFPFGYSSDNKELKTHALGVMNTVGVAVRGLDDLETLKPKLVELGGLHKGFDITDKEFKVI